VKRFSPASPARMAPAALLTAVLFAASTVAQDTPPAPPAAAPAQAAPGQSGQGQAGPGQPGGNRPPRSFPPPKNLQVLPKDLTGAQVREIMEGWAGDLGVHCDTCHAADPNNTMPNGRPRLDFSSDAKDEKAMARIMYTMLQTDKNDYVAKVAAMDKMAEPAAPLTCGTCHRGHLDPEKFTPQEQGPPPGAPAMPGMQH
jgi:hypothetical protein